MKTLYTSILLVLALSTFSQSECSCGRFFNNEIQSPDTIITIKGIDVYSICGYFEGDYISEFTVTKCGTDTILDFYNATLNYQILIDADTLKLIDYRFILSNDLVNFNFTPWAIDMYYQSGKEIIHQRKVIFQKNKNIAYGNDFQLEWDKELKTNWSTNERLIAWTFLISLDHEEIYKKYFENYRSTFKVDGVTAEFYNELKAMYKEYME